MHETVGDPCSPAQLESYLSRVGHRGPLAADAPTLSALHEAHLGAIAFENLEIHLGGEMRIDAESLFTDLVDRRRGGYCFQMNELFARVLLAIGFEVTRHAARVWYANPVDVPPRSHECLEVVDDGGSRWLVDVGFGGQSPLWPLRFGGETPVEQAGTGTYRMDWDPRWGHRVLCVPPAESQERVLYTFTDEPQLPIDFLYPNHGVSTMERSFFVQRRVVSRAERGLRQHLLDRTFTEVRDGVRSERVLDVAEEEKVLRDVFGLTLPDPLVWVHGPSV